MSASRIEYLDGLRGIAILLVVAWHYLGSTYIDWLPYGDAHVNFPLAAKGWMGVELFFLISGFVIFMTLERCAGIREFMLRRWLRLFPAMLIVTVGLFAIDYFDLLTGPHSQTPGRYPGDVLPGLLFVNPNFLKAVARHEFAPLDAVFWSLYVEASFYLIFSAAHFTLGWKRAVAVLVVLAAAVRLATLVAPHLGLPYGLHRIVEPLQWLGIQHFAWFASGALFYKYSTGGGRTTWVAAVAVGVLAIALTPFKLSFSDVAHLAGIVALFTAIQGSHLLQRIVANPVLLFVGFISYPLYLIHNNLGVALIGALAGPLSTTSAFLLVVPVTAIVVLLSWIIARYAEPALAALLKPHVLRLAKWRPRITTRAAAGSGGEV